LDICIFYSLIISLVFSLTICFFSIENLLNNSKSQHGNSELINTQPEHDERHTPSPIDDRHERTGSVKFADQSDEGKESSLQRHNTPHPRELRAWKNKATKKFHATDGNLLHHDHQHPFQPNAHVHGPTDSSHPSISSNQQNKNLVRDSIDYVPPEISSDDRHDSDVC
jgi:hypothetical protein